MFWQRIQTVTMSLGILGSLLSFMVSSFKMLFYLFPGHHDSILPLPHIHLSLRHSITSVLISGPGKNHWSFTSSNFQTRRLILKSFQFVILIKSLSIFQLGITLALLATYLSGIYYAFWCHPVARDFYLVTVGALFLLATAIQFVPNLASEKYSKYRVGLFFFWAIYGVSYFNSFFDSWVSGVFRRIF